MKKLTKIAIIIGVVFALSIPTLALAEGTNDNEINTASKQGDPGGGGY